MTAIWQDIRHGLRMMARHPATTAIAVIALALGIGPNTAIFSIVNSLVWTPPPYPDPDAIVVVDPSASRTPGQPAMRLSADDFQDWRDATQTLEHMALFEPSARTLAGFEEPVQLRGMLASPALFSVLRVPPLHGRVFSPEEEKPGAGRVIVLSYFAWEKYFGKDARLVGRAIKLDNNDYIVVGIMPRTLQFPNAETEFWIPLALQPPQRSADDRRIRVLPFIARLRSGVTLEQAAAEGTAVIRRVNQGDPERSLQLQQTALRLVTLHEQLVGDLRPALIVLSASVGFVLLIACANIANLLLAQAAGRRREMAIRASLGAGRTRLTRQVLTESTLLSLLGGGTGLLLGYWGLALLAKLTPAEITRMRAMSIDLRVLLFTLAVSVLTGLLFGLAPALKSGSDLVEPLKGGDASVVGGTRLFRQSKTRSLLAIGELALALMLLIGAALLANSFMRLISRSPGYDPRGALTLQISLPRARYSQPSQCVAFYSQLLEQLRLLPGVRAAGMTNRMPMSPLNIRISFEIPGRPAAGDTSGPPIASARLVSSGFFQSMSIPLVDGRDFAEQDREGAEPVVIVSETLARRYFPGERAVDQRIDLDGARRIIGVAGDVKPDGLDSEPQPEMYVPYSQFEQLLMAGGPLSAMTFVVRSDHDPLAVLPAIRTRLASLDSQLPLFNVATLDQRVSDSVAQRRFYAVLMGIFAALALVLAAVGIYGVLSYQVAQSTREIGIRMALGADRGRVLRLILGQGALIAASGIILGLCAAWGMSRFVASLLFGITPTHPATYITAALFMGGIGLLGSYIPARRAMAVDPVIAIRSD